MDVLDDLLLQAKEFAFDKHALQTYGDDSYFYHIEQVVDKTSLVLKDDILIFRENEVLSAAYLHDVVEDTDATIGEIANRFGNSVAGIVGLVTDPPGVNRKERKASLYQIFSDAPNNRIKLGASMLKLSDRYCNQFNSILTNDKNKMEMYVKEYKIFMSIFVYPGATVHSGVSKIAQELNIQYGKMQTLIGREAL